MPAFRSLFSGSTAGSRAAGSSVQSSRKRLYLHYLIVWVVCMAVVYVTMLPGRRGLVLTGDGFNIYYPEMSYIRQWFVDLLYGRFRMFDLTVGFGDDVIGTLGCIGFGDILLFPFCLVPESLLDLSYTASVLFRIFLAGFFFLSAVDEELPEEGKIAGAVLYSFCPYIFQFSLPFLTFSTPMVWLPLIVAGVKDLLRGRLRFSKRLFFSVLFLAMSGFYFLYITVVAFLGFFVIDLGYRLFLRRRDGATIPWLRYGRVVGITSLGIFCAFPFLLPMLLHFLQSPRTSAISLSFVKLFGFGSSLGDLDRHVLIPTFEQFVLLETEYDLLRLPLVPIVSFFCLCFLIHHHRELHRGKLMLIGIAALLGFFSDGISLVMNTFSYTYIRYHYLLYFVLAYVTAVVLPELHRRTLADLILATVLIAVWLGMLLGTMRHLNALPWLAAVLVYLVLLLYLLYAGAALRKLSLLALCRAGIYGFLFLAPFQNAGNGFCGATFSLLHGALDGIRGSVLYRVVSGSGSDGQMASEQQLVGQQESGQQSDGFFRYDLRGRSLNASLMLGVPTTYSYYSVCNGSILGLLSEYAVSPAIQGSFIYQGLDERPQLEAVFAVGLYNNGTQEDEITVNLYQLPLGIGYRRVTTETAVAEAGLTPLEKQALLTDTLILEDKALEEARVAELAQASNSSQEMISVQDFHDRLNNLGVVIKELPVTLKTAGDVVIQDDLLTVAGEGAALSVSFDPVADPDTELYLVLPDLYSENRMDILVDEKVLRTLPRDEEGFLPSADRYVNITDLAGTGQVELAFQSAGSYHYTGVKLLSVSHTGLAEEVDALRNASMTDTVIDTNQIRGSVDLTEEAWMLYSIPYSKGWSAMVDGSSVPVVKADYGLMAFFVPAGAHEIRLEYVSPGFIPGCVICVLALLLALIWMRRTSEKATSMEKMAQTEITKSDG